MTTRSSQDSGMTLAEIVVVLAIIVILVSLGASSLSRARTSKQLETITDSIAAKLEEAKTNAMSGKNGTNFGLAIGTSSYVYWSGSSYSPGAAGNVTYQMPGGFIATTTIPGSNHAIMFARITGVPNTTGTITISSTVDASTTDSITIGALGDITVIK